MNKLHVLLTLLLLSSAIIIAQEENSQEAKDTQEKSDISSAMDNVKMEPDGGYKVYVGLKAHAGYENNWVQSNPEKGFFVYMRLYGPLETFFDKSWKMPDVKLWN